MTKKATYLLGIVLTIVIGTILNWWLCCKYTTYETKPANDSTTVVPTPKEKITVPLIIRDPKGDFDFSTDNNLNFNRSAKEIIEPISLKVDTGILKLTKYLSDHPEKNLDITGYYASNEVYDGSFPNLGVARATTVKNHFIGKGILSKQINVFGTLNDNLSQKDSILIGPVAFTIQTLDTITNTNVIDDELNTLKASIKEHPLILYFKTGQTTIHLNAEQRQKVADISKYLDKVEEAKGLIIGHADNVGPANINMTLGQKRADFVKAYLIDNGILPEKLTAISKGSTVPIAPNTTAEGRAKNRRTIFTIN